MVNKYMKQYINMPKGIENSVHLSEFRFKKAEEQSTLKTSSLDVIINHINNYLCEIGVEKVSSPKIKIADVNYNEIKNANNLNDERDLVWIKFTKDGYIGVVAVSNDINFDIPESKEDYNKKIEVYNRWRKQYEEKWQYNTSGIIIHHLEKCWEDSFVLVFPLKNIPNNLSRSDIERGVGNYLIEKKIPILDFYSHNY